MSVFSDAELTYLAKGRLGRLATIDAAVSAHGAMKQIPHGHTGLSSHSSRLLSEFEAAAGTACASDHAGMDRAGIPGGSRRLVPAGLPA